MKDKVSIWVVKYAILIFAIMFSIAFQQKSINEYQVDYQTAISGQYIRDYLKNREIEQQLTHAQLINNPEARQLEIKYINEEKAKLVEPPTALSYQQWFNERGDSIAVFFILCMYVLGGFAYFAIHSATSKSTA